MTTPYQEREDQLQRLASLSCDHLVRGEFGIGEQVAREFLELAKDASDDWHSLAQLRLGTILENAGRYQEALSCAQAAQDVYSPTDGGWYHAAGLIGNIMLNQGDYDSARTQFLSVLERWPDYSFALCSLAGVESKLGNTDSSHRYALRALESAGKADDREHMSVAHNLLGDAELDLENRDQAEKHFRNALAISEEISRRRGISIACQRLSEIEYDGNNYAASLEFGRRAVNAEIEMGRVCNVTDALWRALKGPRKSTNPEVISDAISLCHTALEVVKEPAEKVWILRSEAWFHRDLKQFQHAEKSLDQALGFLEESDEEYARINGMVGILKQGQGFLNEAKASFLGAVELAERHGHRRAKLSAYRSLGYLTNDTGDTFQARRYWRRALQLAQDVGDTEAVEHLKETLEIYQPNLFSWFRSKLPWRRNR